MCIISRRIKVIGKISVKGKMNYINRLVEKSKNVKIVDVLSEKMIWEEHNSTIIWQANKFDGTPCFYPIYNWNNYYSYSILALIIKKHSINFHVDVAETVGSKYLSVLSSNMTIDKDITRIGKAHEYEYSIVNEQEYCEKIAAALVEDVNHIETKNPNFTNVIMCGGKDSLNLLLLPWKNPVLAISAEPNYNLVVQFVKQNNLNVKVEKLEDKYDEEGLQDEVLEACCRVDLSHWRWGIHLKEIISGLSNKAIIWKGQLGDVYMSPTWKSYIYPPKEPILFLCRVYKKLSPFLPDILRRKIGKMIQPSVIRTTWDKSASTQGCHVGFIRALSDCLVLSAYHGPNVMSVFSKAELGAVAQRDIRPYIGKILLGKDVIYPTDNPAPEVSLFRENKHRPKLFLESLKAIGIKIENRSL